MEHSPTSATGTEGAYAVARDAASSVGGAATGRGLRPWANCHTRTRPPARTTRPSPMSSTHFLPFLLRTGRLEKATRIRVVTRGLRLASR